MVVIKMPKKCKKHEYVLVGYKTRQHSDDLPRGYYCRNCGKPKPKSNRRKRVQGSLNPHKKGDKRKFSGKNFTFLHKAYSKSSAKIMAEVQRKDGCLVRVVPARDYKGGYDIFVRRGRKK